MDPVTFVAEAARRPGRIALVFGDERTGLRRDELSRCHALTRIPSDARQPSPNLAQAVRVYAYGLAIAPEGTSSHGAQPGTDADPRRLATVLEELLLTVRFVRPGRAGVGPLVAPRRRSGLTRAETRVWESAIRTLARSLLKPSESSRLTRRQNR